MMVAQGAVTVAKVNGRFVRYLNQLAAKIKKMTQFGIIFFWFRLRLIDDQVIYFNKLSLLTRYGLWYFFVKLLLKSFFTGLFLAFNVLILMETWAKHTL